MATKKSAATLSGSVTRTAQINVSDVTVDDILAAANAVGAPTSARVSTTNTGGYNPNPADGEEVLAYSVSFSWTENVSE